MEIKEKKYEEELAEDIMKILNIMGREAVERRKLNQLKNPTNLMEFKKEEKNQFELWCQANAKIMTLQEFEQKVGIKHEQFFSKNKRYCLSYWRSFQRMARNAGVDTKIKKVKHIPQYILWKEQTLKNRLDKIKELKKQILKT